MKKSRRERGAVLLTIALFLLLLLGFTAIGIEAGRWYLVRAELSKSVDAGALAGAKHLANPHVDPKTLAEQFTQANFPTGFLGTPSTGPGSVQFNVQMLPNGQVHVDGRTQAQPVLAQVVGVRDVPVSSSGMAQKRDVEIMMVLDRSGSMSGQPFEDLKDAAKSFLDHFATTQNTDKVGLISYSTSVQVERALGTQFVAPLQDAIDAMSTDAFTNIEDALDTADGPSGFTPQNGVPAENRVQQFLVFFSDGRPNTFRWTFRRQGRTYDAAVHVDTNCDPGDNHRVVNQLYEPVGVRERALNVNALPTGDGLGAGSRCGGTSTKWDVFEMAPVPGHGPVDCSIAAAELGEHVCRMAEGMAVDHARELKDKGVIVFAIGLGERINRDFLERIATGPEQVYMAPTSEDLTAIFQKVAQNIKLRLVQ
jgi:Flp pilus assembly protein TadG